MSAFPFEQREDLALIFVALIAGISITTAAFITIGGVVAQAHGQTHPTAQAFTPMSETSFDGIISGINMGKELSALQQHESLSLY